MHLKKTLKLVILLLVLTACNNKKYEVKISNKKITFSKFPIEDEIHFKKIKEYKNGDPGWLLIQDSILMILNSNKSSKFFLYNYSLKTQTFSKGVVSKGRGPNEALALHRFGITKNTFWAYDPILKKIFITDKKSILNNTTTAFKNFPTNMSYFDITFVDSTHFLVDGNRSSLAKFEKFRLGNNQVTDTYDQFIDVKKNAPTDGLKEAYQALLFSKPSGEKALLAYRRTDIIEVFNLKNKAKKTIQGPIALDLKLKFQKYGVINIFLRDEKRINTYLNGAVTNKYIYLLFSGKKRDREKGKTDIKFDNSYANEIHVFDWNGLPVKKILLDKSIYAITVSKDDKKLYSFDPTTSFIIQANLN